MPKLKTHSGTKKRIRITRTGKLIRRRANDTHFKSKKTSARKRVTATTATIKGSIADNLKRALGV